MLRTRGQHGCQSSPSSSFQRTRFEAAVPSFSTTFRTKPASFAPPWELCQSHVRVSWRAFARGSCVALFSVLCKITPLFLIVAASTLSSWCSTVTSPLRNRERVGKEAVINVLVSILIAWDLGWGLLLNSGYIQLGNLVRCFVSCLV